MFVITGFIHPPGSSLVQMPDSSYPATILKDAYSGTVLPGKKRFEDGADGVLQWKEGFAKICNWKSGPKGITFLLCPLFRTDVTIFRFNERTETGEWQGIYEGLMLGKGYATCFLSEGSEHSLSAEHVARKLRHYA